MKKLFLIAAAIAAVGATQAQGVKIPQAYMVGDYEVFVLVERSGTGSTDILIDAPQAVVAEYAPAGTFPNATNAVLVRKYDQVWLIDTGYGTNIFAYLDALDVAPEDVDTVLLTHMHGDHIGGLFRGGQKSFPGADVVVSAKEYDYWSSREEMEKLPEERRDAFEAAQKVFQEYGVRVAEPVGIDVEPADGITAIRAYGHTPGHVGYMVKDGKEQLLVWGDLVHAAAVQMPHPEISVTYDVDPAMARVSRMEIMRDVADVDKTPAGEMTPVVGMHLQQTYPAVLYPDGDSGYRLATAVQK